MVTVHRIGALLVVGGAALALLPGLTVRVADGLAARRQSAQVVRWARAQTAAPRPTTPPVAAESATMTAPEPVPERGRDIPTVIESGDDGYLLEIPKLGLRAIVRELEDEVLLGKNTPRLKRFGLGQVPASAGLGHVSPGAEGTAVIAGHRTTSGAPFRGLNRLGPGDLIVLRGAQVEQRWTVVYSTTVEPNAVEVIRSHPGVRRLVLMACSPPFSAAERLVVYATLEGEGAD